MLGSCLQTDGSERRPREEERGGCAVNGYHPVFRANITYPFYPCRLNTDHRYDHVVLLHYYCPTLLNSASDGTVPTRGLSIYY